MIGAGLRDIGSGLASRVRAGIAALRRTRPLVIWLRLLVFTTVLAGFAVAVGTGGVVSRQFLGAVALALMAALLVRTWIVGLALLAVVTAWLVATISGFVAPALWRVLLLAALLYAAHAAAAFVAVLPHDTAVAPEAVRRWALRTAGVVAVSLGIGGAGMLVLAQAQANPNILGPILGSLLAVAIAGLLVWLLRRPA